ncbi:hypothetical protein NPIL_578151 [Nephila pilipes]|uniref:Uncharacterized protein n=1 Tax=Nephila pilipes TaxID=299642 RepID=A0A8X6P7Y5_NEPPI|nr:hypothetical protein NPIL_578151 [Nephila pilipes]
MPIVGALLWGIVKTSGPCGDVQIYARDSAGVVKEDAEAPFLCLLAVDGMFRQLARKEKYASTTRVCWVSIEWKRENR